MAAAMLVSLHCTAGAAPGYCIYKVDSTPDLAQCDPEAGFWQDGELFCGPAAVSNSLMWLANHGFDQLSPKMKTDKESQIAMVKILAAHDLMRTEECGTLAIGIMRGVDRYVARADYRCKRLEYRGWRPLFGSYKSSGEFPDLKWMKEIVCDPGGALWLNVGFYEYDKELSNYNRMGGHWVTVVGYGVDAKGRKDPSILIIHDPSPRSGDTLSHQYCHTVKIEDGSSLNGTDAGLPRSANGQYMIQDGLRAWRGTDRTIIDSAVGLVIGK